MRRFISALLMLLFSVQALCVAADQLCAHDMQVQAIELGGGSHKHIDTTQKTSAEASTQSAAIDLMAHDSSNGCDCSTCHHHVSFVVFFAPGQENLIAYTDYVWPIYTLPVLAEHAGTLYRPPTRL